ncbi:MAG TPA: formate--tetrahydrofolate ligase, partial [Sphingobacteriaceae bacterium]|nr:formate--tetrahydrofolate ligase [Sphingobacteriaceae bacterium]
YTYDKQPVYARDLKAEGAMATLLKDAIKPNLVQTLEGNPAIIHGGPFANIAQGTNTVIATKTGMSLGDYTITEGGFGFDLGAEKFYDIKCQSAGLRPDALVMTVTIRALKYHGGVKLADLKKPDVTALIKGLPNLEKHLENARKFGVPPIIALNRFATDSEEEIAVIEELGERNGIPVAVADVWAKGGSGAIELAAKLVQLIEEGLADFRPLYKWEQDVRTKIETIAKEIYGADNVRYSDRALRDLRRIEHLGLQGLPICIAKTQKSLSDDPTLLGRPTGFDFKIREIEIAAGAGFIIPIAGDMMRMPGLPAKPAAHNIDIDDDGHVSGLF